jgi:hypothetical protein
MEVKILVDNCIFLDKAINETFVSDFVEAAALEENNTMLNSPSQPDKDNQKFIYHKVDSCIPFLIRWTRVPVDELMRLPTRIPPSSMEPFALYMFPIEQFIDLVTKTADGVEFRELGAFLQNCLETIQQNSNGSSAIQLIIGILNLEKELNKLKKKAHYKDYNIPDLVESALTYLVYENDVEIVQWKKPSNFSQYMQTVQKQLLLASLPVEKTDMHFLPTFSKAAAPKDLNEDELKIHELRETWIGMLTTLPSLSTARARSFVQHDAVSCPLKAYKTFNNLSNKPSTSSSSGTVSTTGAPIEHIAGALSAHGVQLVAPKQLSEETIQSIQYMFESGKNGKAANKQVKLSHAVFKMMTSVDHEEKTGS